MKLRSFILLTLALFQCQVYADHSQSDSHSHAKSLRQYIKKINKTTQSTLTNTNTIINGVNTLQNTTNQILTNTNNIQTTDNQILSIVSTLGSGCAILITEADLPYTIIVPGVYEVCGDLLWAPTTDGQTAITVDSNDVVIDFKGYTLRQVDQTKANCIGLQVNPNLTNLNFINGTIEYISSYGTLVYGGVKEIVFDTLNNNFCGYNGSAPLGFNLSCGLAMAHLDLNGNVINSITDVIVRNCNCNYNNSTSTANGQNQVFGCLMDGVNQVLIQNSNFNNNSYDNSSNPSQFAYIGALLIQRSNGVKVDNCNFNGNVGLGSAVNNPFYFQGNDLVLSNAQIAGNSGTGNDLSGPVQIFGNDIMMANCSIQDFTSQATTSLNCGILINGNNVVIDGCSVQNMTATTATSAFDGLLIQGSQIKVLNTVLQDLTNDEGTFTGISVHGDSILLEGCHLQNLTSTNTDIVYGINIFGIEGAVVRDCVVQNLSGVSASTVEGYNIEGTTAFLLENNSMQALRGGVGITAGYNFSASSAGQINSCQAANIIALNTNSTTFTTVSGFQILNDDSLGSVGGDLTFDSCSATSVTNQSSSTLIPGSLAACYQVTGLNGYSSFMEGIVFKNCSAQQASFFTTDYVFTLAYGFYLNNTIGLLVSNCNSNDIYGIGYYLSTQPTGTPPTNSTIINNLAYECRGNGFVDNSGATFGSANVFTRNVAYDNPVNYVAMPPGTPIRTWSISTGTLPPTTGISDLDNIDIQ